MLNAKETLKKIADALNVVSNDEPKTEEVVETPVNENVTLPIIVGEPTFPVEETPVNPITSAGFMVNIPQPFSP